MAPIVWGVLSTARIGLERVIPAMQQSELCDVRAIASRDARRATRRRGGPSHERAGRPREL